MDGVRPILRWAGSKRQLLPRLEGYWSDDYDRYVEPFCGSCSLFFRLAPTNALLADKNSELIEMYEVLRDSPSELHKAASAWQVDETEYLSVRALDPQDLTRLERAARFVYLNRNCFNGIFRTNSSGQFNVPFAKSKQGAIPSCDEFLAAAALLQNVSLRAWDFGSTLRYCKAGDLVYLDPPYYVRSRRVFREYGPKSFESSDLRRLVTHLRKLHERGVRFVVSYVDCPEVRELMAGWRTEQVSVRRNVAGFIGNRRQIAELLISNI